MDKQLLQQILSAVNELSKDVKEMKGDISTLNKKVESIQEDVTLLKEGQERIENHMKLQDKKINDLNNRVYDIEIRTQM